MTNISTKVSLIAAALALGVSTSALYAQSGSDGSAELTLDQAIAIAEAAAGGTALEAEWETENGVRFIEVAVNTASGEMELAIDPVTGEVLSADLDNDDDDRDDDDESDDDDSVDDDDDNDV